MLPIVMMLEHSAATAKAGKNRRSNDQPPWILGKVNTGAAATRAIDALSITPKNQAPAYPTAMPAKIAYSRMRLPPQI